jgi:hypothetical protein
MRWAHVRASVGPLGKEWKTTHLASGLGLPTEQLSSKGTPPHLAIPDYLWTQRC